MVKHIFVVDDDPDDIELFNEAISEISTEVVCSVAENGRIFLDTISQQSVDKPDVIFLDVNMPEMNGWECLDLIKRNNQLKAIPVIMYSTSSALGDAQKATEAGALCFYEKPSSYSMLKDFIEAVVLSKAVNRELIEHLISKSRSHKIHLAT